MTFESYFLCWMFMFHQQKKGIESCCWCLHRSLCQTCRLQTSPTPTSRRLTLTTVSTNRFCWCPVHFKLGWGYFLADFWEQNSQQQTTQTCKECNALTSWSPHYLAFGYKNMIEYWNSPGFILRKISFRRNLQNPSVGMWRVNLARSILQSFS